MATSLTRRALAPLVQLREGESTMAVLMFAFSFLAMTAYNIVQPIVRSRFITALGADNMPYVLLVSVFIIGALMQGYSRLGTLLPGRWVVPATQFGMVALLAGFWVLAGLGNQWVEVAFYLFGQIYGVLLISQFWTLANLIYDARAAKRLFGFIGAGSSLGGITGGAITTLAVESVGNRNLMLVSAAVLAICAVVVITIVRRLEGIEFAGLEEAGKGKGVGGFEALRMLRESRHLQVIAIVIALTSVGAGLIDQQLNMATEFFKGRGATDSMTSVLGKVQVYTSTIGFVIQLWLTTRIHRFLGVGFALLILPVSLSITGATILLNAALWAPMLARVADKSVRYTVDKTTREVLFLPLPAELKHKAKPFVDVTLDRVGRAASAFLLLLLIKPWGLGLSGARWNQISWASLAVMVVWIAIAIRAKRGYVDAFRRSLASHDMVPGEVRLPVADLTTIETLVEELAHPDDRRVLYAIELLEALEKRHLVTPLLLQHGSPRVRARTLQALRGQDPERAARSLPAVERLLRDEDADVRAGAVQVMAAAGGQNATDLMRRYLSASDPRMVVTAAAALAASPDAADVDAAESALQHLLDDSSEAAAPARAEIAGALGRLSDERFRHLLVPLMFDGNVEVARAAIQSAGRVGLDGSLFVPPLVSLLRHRLLKADAREVLVGYGESVLEPLAYFLQDEEEDLWVRRHVPATMARIPGQPTVDVLVRCLSDRDGFLRYKAVTALETLRRERPDLVISREPIERLILDESRRFCNALTLRANLCDNETIGLDTVLARALEEKQRRCRDLVFRLLGLIYPQKDISSAQFALEQHDGRGRAGASEYLDNVLTGALRKHVMLMIEDMPHEDRVRRANVQFSTRRRDPEDTLAQLIHDEDQVLAAAAIHLAAERGLWTLTDDVEYALAHHDLRDWYVFEAASWALAATRMNVDQRRGRWLEPLPAVEVVNRLRRLSLFHYLSVDELFRVAGAGRQVRHERGRTLYHAGLRPDTLQLLIDGEVQVEETGRVPAPAALAFEEMIEATPVRAAIHASDVAITISLTHNELLALLSDNIELAHGLFKMLMEEAGRAGDTRIVHGHLPPEIGRRALGSLTTVERVLVLQASPLLARATGDQLLRLAAIAREVPLAKGGVLYTEADDPAILVVLTGALVLEGPAPLGVRPGDMVGAYETLAGGRAGRQVKVTESGTALCLDRRALVDLLTDHVDLLQGMLSALLRRTTDLTQESSPRRV
jgi:HEAT repeat protein/CRP-like cAMP-binding protein